MGLSLWCYLGFSCLHLDDLSHEVETTHGRTIATNHARFFADYVDALGQLHEAVDAACEGRRRAAEQHIDSGLERLEAANRRVTEIGTALSTTRRVVTEAAAHRPDNPLVARERFFHLLDYEALFDRLRTDGAVLPSQVYWRDMVATVRSGGSRAGLRLLEKSTRLLQGALRFFTAEVERCRSLQDRELAHTLHDLSGESIAIQQRWLALLTQASYLMVVCSRATERLELEAYGDLDDDLVAVQSTA